MFAIADLHVLFISKSNLCYVSQDSDFGLEGGHAKLVG